MIRPKDRKTEWYVSHFERFEKNLNGHAASAIHTVRKAAIARFAEIGFPTTRDEEWKYTDVSPLVEVRFKPVLRFEVDGVTSEDIARLPFGDEQWAKVVCINGHFVKEFSSFASLPRGVRVGGLAEALETEKDLVARHLARYARYEDNAFTALSTAFMLDGAFVAIPDGAILEKPIHLVFVSSDFESEVVSHPRTLIVLGSNSQATVIETYVSLTKKSYFTNVVTEAVLGENAVLEHEKTQLEGDRAFHVATLHVHQARSSNFVSNSISFGGTLVRNNLTCVLDGEGAEATLNGLYLATGDQLIDNHTTIDHAKPHCASHELYKGILDGKSRGVFNGKILVRKDAQKTDAKQTNKNLVLSDGATIDTKPQLEIFANDVKCTHGATIGQIDDEALFYLRARGIGFDTAREMLIYAFASDVMGRIRVESLRERLQSMLREWLEGPRRLKTQK